MDHPKNHSLFGLGLPGYTVDGKQKSGESPPVEVTVVYQFIPLFTVFLHPRWLFGISSINSIITRWSGSYAELSISGYIHRVRFVEVLAWEYLVYVVLTWEPNKSQVSQISSKHAHRICSAKDSQNYSISSAPHCPPPSICGGWQMSSDQTLFI